MEKSAKIGVGIFALLMGASLLAMRPHEETKGDPHILAAAHLKLAAVSTQARHDVDYAALDARMRELVDKPAMVGLAVGVVENGRITFLHGYGETAEGSGDPVTAETVFRWASCSKGVAATMVAKLAEKGKINLDAPVANYAPDLKLPQGNEYRATVTDLLSHRLGLYHNAYDNKLEEGQDPRVLRTSLAQLNAVCKPGTCWDYQNVAFDASSVIVSRTMHMPYEQAVETTLFNPIGMTGASVSMAGIESSPSWAKPHSAGRKTLPMSDDYYRVPAAGGVNSNIKDMALWMLAQMGEMPDVISPGVLEALHSRLVKTPNERGRLHMASSDRLGTAWYGMGWRSYDYAGHRIVGHRGGINGYRSLILFDPEKKSGVVALWNSNTNRPGGLEFEIMDQIYHLPFRDWLELDMPSPGSHSVAEAEDQSDSGDGGVAPARTRSKRVRHG